MALLLITAGRGSGVPFELQPVTRIGRAPDNTLVLQDTVSSRYHARIVRRASDYFIEDLGSLNGTLVNSRPVHQSKLEDGDVIVIGGTELTFSTKSRPGSNASYYERHPSQELIVPHIIKVLEQRSGAAGATMSDSDEAAIEEPWLGREERSRSGHLLEGLLELIRLQRSNVGVAESIEMMLERSLGLFDAFRVAILTPETSGRYEPLIVIPAKLRDADISQPEIDWVVQTQSSIVSCRPTVEDDEDSTALSRKPETILAAPVIANTSVIGVLYLESHVEASSFDESHLELLGAIATLLSVTVERLATLKGAATLSIPDSLEETLPISPRQPARSQFVPWDVASRIHDELLIGPIAALRTAKESGESRDALVLEEDLAQLGREVDHYLGITRISEPHTEASLTELLSRFAARWSVAPSTGAIPLELAGEAPITLVCDPARLEFVMHRIAGAIGRVGRENLRATLTTARIQGLIQIELTIAPGEIGDAFRREFNRGLGRLVGEEIIRAHGGRLTVSSATDSAVFVRLTLRDGVTAAER